MNSIIQKMKETTITAALDQALNYLSKNPEENIPKVMSLVDQIVPNGWYDEQRKAFRQAIERKDNWYDLMLKVWNLDQNIVSAFFKNFIVKASLSGGVRQEKIRESEGCNVPWAILLDPTSACDLHCTGCWAAEYGNRLNLTFEELDSIVQRGKEFCPGDQSGRF